MILWCKPSSGARCRPKSISSPNLCSPSIGWKACSGSALGGPPQGPQPFFGGGGGPPPVGAIGRDGAGIDGAAGRARGIDGRGGAAAAGFFTADAFLAGARLAA